MRLKKKFKLCDIGGQAFLIPMGEAVIDVKAMLDLNEVGAFIIKLLQEKDYSMEEMEEAVYNEYECDRDVISGDLNRFVEKAVRIGILETAQ